jgi:hypothetical protein
VTPDVVRTPTKATITITGHAGRGRAAGRIYVHGRTTAANGSLVTVRTRVAGTRVYASSGTRRVRADGTFTWQQRASSPVYVYVRAGRGVFSNRVLIRPVR